MIVIITDDHGSVDAGCYGSNDLTTPNIDALARPRRALHAVLRRRPGHGRSASRTRTRSVHAHLRDLGHPTLSLTFRGHGDSDANHNDFGYSSRLDVISGVRELKRRGPRNKVIVLGASLGAAAVNHATGELGTDVDAYFLESPHSHLYTAARNRCDVYLPPVLAHAAYASPRPWAPVLLPPTPAQPRPIDHVAGVRVPVGIVASVEDRLARIDEARALRDRHPTHCTLVEFPNGSHGRLVRVHREAHLAAPQDLIARIRWRNAGPLVMLLGR